MKVLLADDDLNVRSALKLLLEQEPRFERITEVTTIMDLKDSLASDCPDLLILDVELPDLVLERDLHLLAAQYDRLKIICLSGRQPALILPPDLEKVVFIDKWEAPDRLLDVLA